MKRLNNIHPGEILSEEFLIPMNITAYRLVSPAVSLHSSALRLERTRWGILLVRH